MFNARNATLLVSGEQEMDFEIHPQLNSGSRSYPYEFQEGDEVVIYCEVYAGIKETKDGVVVTGNAKKRLLNVFFLF